MIPNKMVADLISLYLQKKWFSRFNVEWINLTKVSACQNKRLFFIWWNYNESSNFVYLISSMLACYVISDYKKFSLCSLFTYRMMHTASLNRKGSFNTPTLRVIHLWSIISCWTIFFSIILRVRQHYLIWLWTMIILW